MTGILRRIGAIDFSILDRVYTPVAHWAHDRLGVRSYQIGHACLFGLAISAVYQTEPWKKAIEGALCAGTLFTEVVWRVETKIGFVNSRRLTDHMIRCVWILLVALDALPYPTTHLFFSFGYLSCLMFCAVTECPRKPKLVPQIDAISEASR